MFSDLLWMRLDITISVLLKFSEILLALSHWTKLERSGQLSIATSKNLSVVNTIYIYIYIYILETAETLILSLGACHTQYLKVQTLCC